jgi:hypothetical protein
VFFTKKKKRTVENGSWFYHIFHKNSVLVHAKTTTSYDTVENALSILELNVNIILILTFTVEQQKMTYLVPFLVIFTRRSVTLRRAFHTLALWD